MSQRSSREQRINHTTGRSPTNIVAHDMQYKIDSRTDMDSPEASPPKSRTIDRRKRS